MRTAVRGRSSIRSQRHAGELRGVAGAGTAQGLTLGAKRKGLEMISAIRAILTLIYAIVSLIAAISITIKGSFVVGMGVLVACAFSFFGTATFVGSFLARKEKAFTVIDLIGIGSIAAILVAMGFMLAYWTGFRVIFEGWIIDGFYWLLIGMLTALLVTRKENAL
jgi:hypothetical protein